MDNEQNSLLRPGEKIEDLSDIINIFIEWKPLTNWGYDKDGNN